MPPTPRSPLASSLLALALVAGCGAPESPDGPAGASAVAATPEPEYFLSRDQTHNKFSRSIPPVLTVPSGAVVEAETEEATDAQLHPGSTADDLASLDFDLIHALTGPVYVEGAEPGDVLAVTLHEIEVGDWGWMAITPDFGILAGEMNETWLRTFTLGPDAKTVRFAEGIEIPLRPFAGVLGVAPDTDERLSTIPPRANGGNMDDPEIVAGTTVYFPVFVEGALFSIGDTHAVQGAGEVCGTAVEAPMRVVYQLDVIKGGRPIQEPQYETDEHYTVTAFATTLDEAAKKATRYMLDYLVAERGLGRTEAYALASLAADLQIAEVVDVPHVLVTMRIPKGIFQD